MKEQKRGGGTLREYRVLHWRITVETYNARTPKLWQVTVVDHNAALRLIGQSVVKDALKAHPPLQPHVVWDAPTPLTESDS